MTKDEQTRRIVVIGLGGQLLHALVQVVLAAVLDGTSYVLLAASAFVLASITALYTADEFRAGGSHGANETGRTDRGPSDDWSPVEDDVREASPTAGEDDDERVPSLDGRDAEVPDSSTGDVDPTPLEPMGPLRLTPDGGVTTESGDLEDVEEYLDACVQTLSAAGEGDLTRRMDEDAPTEALETLATEFDEMTAAFEQTIETAGDFSGDVADSSEQVTAATEAVKDASENVAGTVQEIADVFHEQHQQISRISKEMSQMSATVEEIAASAEEVTEMADKTERRTVDGIESGRDARDRMETAATQTEDVVETVETLNDRMDEVGQIVDLIDDIAEQTNILALNASIEAAHASNGGGDSNGFTVVADEVKSLAGETKDATNQIESLINDIQRQTGDAVDEIRDMRDSVEDGKDGVDEGLTALESIMEHVQKTCSGVREIANTTDDQAASAQEVAAIADEAAQTSKDNVEEAERVGSIAEEQNLALGEMYVNVKMLTMRARQLSALFDDYETGEE